MMNRYIKGLAAVAMLVASSDTALAFGKKKAKCSDCDAGPGYSHGYEASYGSSHDMSCGGGVSYQDVEKTVMVPEWGTETRKVTTWESVPVQKSRQVTVQRQVWEDQQQKRTVTEYVREEKVDQVRYTVSVPVWKEEARKYTVMVPHQEKRTGTRQVCKMVSAVEKRTVHEDQGHWEEQPCDMPAHHHAAPACGAPACGEPACGAPTCEAPCESKKKFFLTGLFKKKNKCAPACEPACDAAPACDAGPACGSCGAAPAAMAMKKVWVAKPVTREIEVNVTRPTYVTENFDYTVTVCRPEERTSTVKVCSYERQERTSERRYTVCVPRTREETVNVKVCKYVPETRTENYTTYESRQVQKDVQVRVCRMVPKTVMVKVAVAAPAMHCGSHEAGHGGCGHEGGCGGNAGCGHEGGCGGCH